MLPTPAAGLVPHPRALTPHDYVHPCYLLVDTVETNIPRRECLGGLGAHQWARGHLVELHRRLGGVPLSLHYEELSIRPHGPTVTGRPVPEGTRQEVTARLLDRTGQPITVVTHNEHWPGGPRGDYWQVTVNGRVPDGADDPGLNGVHTYSPSLPFLGFLVDRYLYRSARRLVSRDT